MKNLLITILLASALWSCDIQKEASKTKNDIDYSEWLKTESFRKGDTVSFLVPKYKDTTIYVTNRQGTTIRTIYDQQGQVSNIDCYASTIKELTEMNIKLIDQSKEKESVKTEEIGMQFIPWLIGGIVVMFLIFMIILLIYIRGKNKKFDAFSELIKNKL
jgi:YD repeat-containing protein